METIATQVVVVGGGPGGYPAAFVAADHGLQVTLVDTEVNPGGVCLYRGCIPSKALLHVAELINSAHEAEACGLTFGAPQLDVDKLRAWKESVVQRMTGGLGQLRQMRKVNMIQGRGTFVDAHTLSIARADGETQLVKFEHAIVATGSRPVSIPIAPKSPRVMDSTGALALPDVPKRLLVIGGGYIGLELGQAYSAFGSRVSVVEMLPQLLTGADRDLANILIQRLKKQFSTIWLETKVTAITEDGEAIRVSMEDKAGKAFAEVFDRVLISVGRKPNTENLGLEKTKVKVNARGFIEVDAQRRTAEPTIFAIGDVAGQPMLAHKATHEAHVAADAIAGKKTVFAPAAIPAVVFTDPEIAWCGITEIEAQQKDAKIKVLKFPWAASGRATTLGRSDGLTKIIVDADSGRVLGMGIAGHGAGELIAEGTLAIEMGAVAQDLALTIHAHPTLSETSMEAAEAYAGHSIHFAGKR
ncbi:MAG: dihydrolipoyl dehydrogenase [Verrucomicrobia bacterium]|nr:dihydrolipoyl dehydrogenase [Verrucomicrobiota bacterium]